eukprot:4789243-Pyramimonas_sp.AAC.1
MSTDTSALASPLEERRSRHPPRVSKKIGTEVFRGFRPSRALTGPRGRQTKTQDEKRAPGNGSTPLGVDV